jgi:hypothetical protein
MPPKKTIFFIGFFLSWSRRWHLFPAAATNTADRSTTMPADRQFGKEKTENVAEMLTE